MEQVKAPGKKRTTCSKRREKSCQIDKILHLVYCSNLIPIFFTLLGLSRSGSGSLLMDDTGILLLGAIAPGVEMYRGFLQDVRIFTRSLDDT